MQLKAVHARAGPSQETKKQKAGERSAVSIDLRSEASLRWLHFYNGRRTMHGFLTVARTSLYD
jgi:hypothetical protein